jgi:hypothetical protein
MDRPDELPSGDVTVDAVGELTARGVHGTDLKVSLTIANQGQSSPRVDLSRTTLRADGFTWEPCRHPSGTDKEAMMRILRPAERITVELLCEDIPMPKQNLDLRFFASGAGGQGILDVRLHTPQPLEP